MSETLNVACFRVHVQLGSLTLEKAEWPSVLGAGRHIRVQDPGPSDHLAGVVSQ